GEPDHQPRRFAGAADALVIERPECSLEALPIDQPGEPHQFVLGVELAGQAGAEQVVGTLRFRRPWTHGKSPENCLPESGFRHSRILAYSEESLISQSLGPFSGPTNSSLRRTAEVDPLDHCGDVGEPVAIRTIAARVLAANP